jgi:WD40 repeat protein
VNALAITENTLAFGNFAGKVGVFDIVTGEGGTVYKQLSSPINAVAWCPCGATLCIAEYSGQVTRIPRLDALRLGKSETIFTSPAAIKDLAWMSCHELAAAATNGTVYLLDLNSHEVKELRGHGNLINAVAVNMDADGGYLLASASRDRTARVWDPVEGRMLHLLGGHAESVKSIAWSPREPNLLATGSYDFDVRVWDLHRDPSDEEFSVILAYHRQGVSSLCWGEQGLISGSWDGSVVLWDVGSKSVRTVFTDAAGGMNDL